MTGFDRELRQKVIDFDAHILVSTEDVLRDWRSLKTKIDNTPGVVATAPYIQGPVIVEFQNRRLAPLIRGVDPARGREGHSAAKIHQIRQRSIWKEIRPYSESSSRENCKRHVGDKLTVYSPGNLGQILDGIKKLRTRRATKRKRRSTNCAM